MVALSLVGAQFLSSLPGMLRDKDVDVRLAAVASLAEVKNEQAASALRRGDAKGRHPGSVPPK